MPKSNPPLDSDVIAGIHDWIARGAHLNEPDDVTGTECTPNTDLTDMSVALDMSMPIDMSIQD
jgi:hypothetical protein